MVNSNIPPPAWHCVDRYRKPGTHQADGRMLANVRWMLSIARFKLFWGVPHHCLSSNALCFSADSACRFRGGAVSEKENSNWLFGLVNELKEKAELMKANQWWSKERNQRRLLSFYRFLFIYPQEYDQGLTMPVPFATWQTWLEKSYLLCLSAQF